MAELIQIPTPADFSYRATIMSHGWLGLAPFSYDETTGILTRIHQLEDGKTVLLAIGDGLQAQVKGIKALNEVQRQRIMRDMRLMFSLDWDLSAFYQLLQNQDRYAWIERQKVGRMLVAPTVWEDLAKTLLTTNTTWSQTKAMVARLCLLGKRHTTGQHAFPEPQQIAGMTVETFAEKVRAGYRAAYLHDLATRIASDTLDVEAWRNLPSDELYKAIKGLRGFGDYAAGTMLRLLGHFDRLAIDTECRAAYKRITGSETASDKEIHTYYEPFGRWRGLVMWMNIMGE